MKVERTAQHHWLEQLTGRWRVIFDFDEHSVWTEDARSLDGLWHIAEMSGPMPDGSMATMVMTLGYDPDRKCFVGSTIGTMMRNLWVYEGRLDETGKVLTLDCEGPDMDGSGRLARFQDIIEIVDTDTRRFSSRMQSADGSWKPVMAAQYKRVTAP